MAQDQGCVARVNGTDMVVAAGAVITDPDGVTLRERLLGWPRQTWNQAWGAPRTCDSETTIAFLGAVLAVEQIDQYCLSFDAETDGFLLVPGARNFRGRCQKTVCERVNIARDQTTGFLGGMMQAVLQPPQTGLLGLTHSSGAMLLTGQRGVLLDTLGTTATSVTAALSTPAAMTAAAVTVMTVGSAVYVCRE
jgi:hypothetical protein